ncbi:MAG TPA: nucleoside triphosphate pyrophosphatase [Marinospirillum sp.]|uniref:Maf family protein n=1 Tax=Marinospirillum sp. TaxID=2183934 RepID=UPI002B48EF14|nr:nucleoside triphosphate pyrophosphatase [Marinospirillum sp.]HKM14697.1 nucleoside triphosphate pyrophosphatase [Marinospirillum sp.]
MQILLASSSSYRKALLERLHLAFQCASPEIDETPKPNETAEHLVKRLAFEKARKIASLYPNALIIGSDQAAVLDGAIIGKPHTVENAVKQLQQANGKTLQLMTGLCLYNSHTEKYQLDMVPFAVNMRCLSDEALRRYVALDKPLDCAGSFKWEQLGIALFSSMQGDDVTALQGLPLIRLIDMLQEEGVMVL